MTFESFSYLYGCYDLLPTVSLAHQYSRSQQKKENKIKIVSDGMVSGQEKPRRDSHLSNS